MFWKLKKRVYRNIEKNEISFKEFEKMDMKSGILIDVRSPQEYREGHLKNAILIPEYEIIKRCKNELPEKDQLIVLYCEAGMRSRKARRKLRRMEYTNVYNIYDVTMQDFKK